MTSGAGASARRVVTDRESAPTAGAAHARKSSFYLAMRILPKPQRQAMYAVYAFCRHVDDIADEGGPRPARQAALERWRADIDAIYAPNGVNAYGADLRELAGAIHAFGLDRDDFHAVIDGMATDVAADVRAPDWATLDLYCDRVASAVGRLSVRIFGVAHEHGPALAHHLGRALQLTNILRDIDEDAAIHRLYLPREALEAAGIAARDPLVVAADPRLPAVCAPVAERAAGHFTQARAIMARCSRASTRAPRIMNEAYGEIFARTVARGFALPRRRMRVSKARFVLSLLRHGLI